jgi:hypothetical protein
MWNMNIHSTVFKVTRTRHGHGHGQGHEQGKGHGQGHGIGQGRTRTWNWNTFAEYPCGAVVPVALYGLAMTRHVASSNIAKNR